MNSDRRKGDDAGYNGPERRKRTRSERRQDFDYRRDQVLLIVGVIGVLGIAGAAVIVGIKDSSVALAALALFGGFLGAPTVLRLDEARERRRARDEA